jgi:hypothetical protein
VTLGIRFAGFMHSDDFSEGEGVRMSMFRAQMTCSPQQRALLKMVRPSVLDLRFTGDPWIVARSDGNFHLCLGDYCLAGIRGVNLDLPSLNQVLDRMRHRRPRR